MTGGIHLYEREPSKVQPAQPSAPKIQHPRSPTPMDMEEKLIRLERFAIYERNLHHYSEEKGVYEKIDRDAAKAIIRNRLKEDLRVRGTANQIQEVYEFLRLDERLKVNSAPPKHLLAFTNGVLNLRTGVFTAGHSPDLFLTWRLEIPYQAGNHSCPIFDSVVQQISGGDPVFIARVFEVLGYLLVPSSFMKGIVLFQGLSGAGKSVLSRLIATYFDPSIIAHIAVALFENRFAPATLEGCRLSSSMDLPGGKIKAEAIAMLKQITGGDAIFVETKGVDGHSAHLDCRFLFGTNHAFVPAVHDEAFIDRIILLPFRFAVPTEMVDQDLDDKLLPERSAIFNLALEAFYRLQRNHFQFTGEERYGIRTAGIGNSEADPMMALFLEECCVLDPVGQVPSSTLFDAYNAYLASHGQSFAGTSQQFSRVFNEATPPTVVPKKIRINSKPTNCYVGVKLKEESHEQ